MSNLHGFTLERETTIPEYNTQVKIYRHNKSGAELISMENDDDNKVFGVLLRTPPPDSTGVAHIMEHAVLGGSRKYPLKEPFVQLLKGSLYTFLNAFTANDFTAYPVASQNLQDFYNLVDVYLDAVFHPLITPHHLDQEGWHFELEDPDGPLRYRGVVFNEMKGVYSSPDAILGRLSQQSLFPETAYGHDSGGNPEAIPDLTYEQFRNFHASYYHPSNALLYFYGNDDPKERLRIAGAYLDEFDAHADAPQPVDPIALQARFDAPRTITQAYGVEGESDLSKKGIVQLNWLTTDATKQDGNGRVAYDPDLVAALSVLSHALVGTQASPLRKALIDSGLGEEVTGGGLSGYTRQMTFHVGLKGINPDDAPKVEQLILDTLAELAENGLDKDTVDASFNSIEFALRENNTGGFPRGLGLLMRGARTWINQNDLTASLYFEEPLATLRARLDRDPDFFPGLIREYLLDNPHRTTVILHPDPEFDKQREAAERARLAEIRSELGPDQVQAILDNMQALKHYQEQVDSPELLAKVPALALGDLDRETPTIPLEVSHADGAHYLYHDIFTNGIVYLDVGFNFKVVPADLLPYAKLFSRALVEIGTECEDYVKLSQRIGKSTGGINPSTLLAARRDDPAGAAWLLVSGKATEAKAPELLEILHDILTTVKLDNRDRFRQMVLRAKANLEAGLIPSGHSVVDGRLRASFTTTSWAAEQMSGISYLFFLRDLARQVETDWEGVLARLEEVRRLLITRQGMICNATMDSDMWSRFQPQLAEFVRSLPTPDSTPSSWSPTFETDNEGLAMPAQVNYVGKAANLYDLGYTLHGSVDVINNLVRTGYLWEKIRVQGGAYGAFCRFNQHSGVYSFLSYRDPNLVNTLDVYDRTAEYLRTLSLSQDELTKNIIGAVGHLDSYQLPDAKGHTSMVRYLIGETDEQRQQFRDEVLGTTVADFHAFADVLTAVAAQGRIVVLGSQDAIQAANQAREGLMTVRAIM
jgi:presequence protease